MFTILWLLIIICCAVLLLCPVSVTRTLVLFIFILMGLVFTIWFKGFNYISLILVMVYVSAISILFAMVVMVTESEDDDSNTGETLLSLGLWLFALVYIAFPESINTDSIGSVSLNAASNLESNLSSILVDQHVLGIILLAVILLLGVLGVLFIL